MDAYEYGAADRNLKSIKLSSLKKPKEVLNILRLLN